jgi:hypothetical protein
MLVGLHRQAQPAAALPLGRQDTHPGHAEHHRCRRAALSTVHLVEAFGTVSLVATDLRRPRPVSRSGRHYRRVAATTLRSEEPS